MAKTPTKAATKAPSTATKKTPKALNTPAAAAEKPIKVAKPPKSNGIASPKVKKAPKPAKTTRLEDLSTSISHIASEIIADRIVPTLEQIKALAQHALGKSAKKAKKADKPAKAKSTAKKK